MIKILIYDKYTNDYYEVIPIKKIEEKIEELQDNVERIKKQYSNGGQNCNSEYLGNLAQIKILQQLIKENCESEE